MNATFEGNAVAELAVAVPVSAEVWGLPVALSVIDKVPVKVPLAVGTNTTLIVQLVPDCKMVGQPLNCEKPCPATAIPEIFKPTPPVLNNRKLRWMLAPTTAVRLTDAGVSVTAGVVPVVTFTVGVFTLLDAR